MIQENVFAMFVINMQQNNSFHDVNSNNAYIVSLIIYLLISSSPVTFLAYSVFLLSFLVDKCILRPGISSKAFNMHIFQYEVKVQT